MDLKHFESLVKPPATPAEDTRAMTVTQLNRYVETLLGNDGLLSAVAVRGEISNFVAHRTGHLYFSLKDEGGVVRAVMFRSDAARLRFAPENGMKVLLYGRVSLYVAGGQYQLYATAMEPDGLGALYLAFEQRRKRLEAEGLFAPERKRPLPRYPMHIGVITSPSGAAVRDILQILGRRFPAASVFVYPATVQGEDAPPSLIAGLSYFNRTHSADLLIIGRGGGSMEDLFAFNDEELVRAVAASEIPVISAVGHETDFTLCDFAADVRAPTPSAAAELAVPDRGELVLRLQDTDRQLRRLLLAWVERRRERLRLLSARPVLARPRDRLDACRMQVVTATERLTRAMTALIEGRRFSLGKGAARLEALSPLAVLTRGYCAAADEDGAAITSAASVSAGDSLTLRFADGVVLGRAEEVKTEKEINREQ